MWLAKSGLSPKAVAVTMGVCPKTVGKWVARFEAEGVAGLQDRSSRPHSLNRPTQGRDASAIVTLRRQRLAYSEIYPDEKRGSCLSFLVDALRFFRHHGIAVERVMTDNGSAFKSRRYAKALRWLGIAHKRTRPYTPKTNGKVERFVQTSLREWAYAHAYETSDQRGQELSAFLFRYGWQRPRMGIDRQSPIGRLGLSQDNLLMTPQLGH